jgi:hypothetical protein
VYLYADYGCGIFRLDQNGNRFTSSPFVADVEGVVHLAFGPWRERQALYYTTYAGGGQIRRIVHTGAIRLAVQWFSVTRLARAGRPLTARLEVRAVGAATAACSARIGSRAVPSKSSVRHAGGDVVATCVWHVPRRTAGRTLRGSIAVTIEGSRLARSFVRTIRA